METDKVKSGEWIFFILAALGAALLGALHPLKAIDFRAYWEDAHHYYRSGAPMYGPASGLGWAGGVFRYPPIFLDLFRPWAALPLRPAVALWGVGKIAVAAVLAIGLRRRWGVVNLGLLWPGLVLLAPYFIEELRGGNAQFYIAAAVIAAFLALESHPQRAGFWLGFAAALKVWPLFFFPFWLVERRWRALAAACASGLAWTLLPALWRGWSAQCALLGQWLAQERVIASISGRLGELWYPGQSLHDVMARYCSVINYAQLSDAGYPQVAWLHWAPATVEAVWAALVVLLLLGLVCLLLREPAIHPSETRGAAALGPAPIMGGVAALLFCALLVVEPHVHRIIYTTLLWPALWLAAQRAQGRLQGAWNGIFWLAVAVAALQPLVPGGGRQRLMQAYGVDFWLVLIPMTAVCVRLAGVAPFAPRAKPARNGREISQDGPPPASNEARPQRGLRRLGAPGPPVL